MSSDKPFKLITRFDFDGICCAVLLRELKIIEEVVYVHPRDMQNGKHAVTDNDVLANIPLVKGCALWFDHHSSEHERHELEGAFKGSSRILPSAARVIYDYYDGARTLSRFDEMMEEVDKADSANFTADDVLNPKDWVLFSFVCDPKSGLVGGDFKMDGEQFMQFVIDLLLEEQDISKILANSHIKERTDQYFEQEKLFHKYMESKSRVEGSVIITELRGETVIPSGNRFLVYSMFPQANISIRVADAGEGKVTFSVGHSVINRSCNVDVGSLMFRRGGGGHKAVGTCQSPVESADAFLAELVSDINSAN